MEYLGDPQHHDALYRMLKRLEDAGCVGANSSSDFDPADEFGRQLADLAHGDRLIGYEGFTSAYVTNPVGRRFLRDYETEHGDPAEHKFRRWRRWLAEVPEAADLLFGLLDAGTYEFFTLGVMSGEVLLRGDGVERTLESRRVLNDLVEQELLRPVNSSGDKQYEVPADVQRFGSWRKRQPTPAETVHATVQPETNNHERSSAVQQLADAFVMLEQSDLGLQRHVITIGSHLRSSINLAMSAFVGAPTEYVDHPKRDDTFKHLVENLDDPQRRHGIALVELLKHVQKVNQSLDHDIDQASQGSAPSTRDDVRRACFLTAVAVYELERFTPPVDEVHGP